MELVNKRINPKYLKDMAKDGEALVRKSGGSNPMGVRFPPSAPHIL